MWGGHRGRARAQPTGCGWPCPTSKATVGVVATDSQHCQKLFHLKKSLSSLFIAGGEQGHLRCGGV